MSRAQRLERLRASFDTHAIDALVVSQPESRYYLSGYTGHDLPPRDSAGYLLISATQALLLTDPRTTEQAQQQSPEYEVTTYGSGNRGPEAIATAVEMLLNHEHLTLQDADTVALRELNRKVLADELAARLRAAIAEYKQIAAR